MKAGTPVEPMVAGAASGGEALRLFERLAAPVLLVARVCLAFEFVLFGMRKLLHPGHVGSMLADHGIPSALVYLVIPFQLVCGWLAALGLQTRLASLALCGFCLVAPSIFHTHSLDNWSRDIASAGGWLLLALFGPGRWSLDARLGPLGRAIPSVLYGTQRQLSFLMAAARVLVAVHFISCGIRDALTSDPAALQIGVPGLAMPIAALQIAGGLLILLGWHTRVACAVMALYVLARASTVHSPAAELGLFREGGSVAFFVDALLHSMGGVISSYGKDMAVFGALLTLWIHGPGALSLSGSRASARSDRP
jgi:putative oxidoreductase